MCSRATGLRRAREGVMNPMKAAPGLVPGGSGAAVGVGLGLSVEVLEEDEDAEADGNWAKTKTSAGPGPALDRVEDAGVVGEGLINPMILPASTVGTGWSGIRSRHRPQYLKIQQPKIQHRRGSVVPGEDTQYLNASTRWSLLVYFICSPPDRLQHLNNSTSDIRHRGASASVEAPGGEEDADADDWTNTSAEPGRGTAHDCAGDVGEAGGGSPSILNARRSRPQSLNIGHRTLWAVSPSRRSLKWRKTQRRRHMGEDLGLGTAHDRAVDAGATGGGSDQPDDPGRPGDGTVWSGGVVGLRRSLNSKTRRPATGTQHLKTSKSSIDAVSWCWGRGVARWVYGGHPHSAPSTQHSSLDLNARHLWSSKSDAVGRRFPVLQGMFLRGGRRGGLDEDLGLERRTTALWASGVAGRGPDHPMTLAPGDGTVGRGCALWQVVGAVKREVFWGFRG
ncbi:uncharacterized protein BXZ73DRAFT_75143 [Epithele typhae]|uniref:uncharacterized protein n=1 Tax=Epithele typhae TaxID=378194 RepID=UPI0020088C3E|nr:uncharacterized protein BXZ73DRAFT_75143 [Epithele typhae]KAH9941176.1 hypothetical protein BXZ73DRAFT_75143 [Epithele typhae]